MQKMKGRLGRQLGWMIALLALAALGGCKWGAPDTPAAQTPEVTETEVVVTAESAATETLGAPAGLPTTADAYPAPVTPEAFDPYPNPVTPTVFDPYPGPEGAAAAVSATPYPGPGGPAPAVSPSPYPGPGGAVTPTTGSGGSGGAFIAGTPTPAASPPAAGVTTTVTPAGETPASVSPTGEAPTDGSTLTPAVTPTPQFSPTPTVVRTPVSARLRASDPLKFKLASGKWQLVEFFAFWSGTSQGMAPVVHTLEADYRSRMNFVYLDIDNPAVQPLMKTLRYRVEPHFFLIDPEGNVEHQWTGYVDEAELRQALEAVLQ